MKKKLSILLCLLLILSLLLAACGKKMEDEENSQEPADDVGGETNKPDDKGDEAKGLPEPEVELKPYRIAYLYYDLASEQFTNFKNAFEPLGEELNCEFIYVEANTPDYYMEAMENVLASGIDAFVTASTGGMVQQFMSACEEKGVYLAVCDNDITSEPGFAETVADNEYFAGYMYGAKYDMAYACGAAMCEFDIETYVAHGLPPGVAQMLDDNFDGGVAAFADNGVEKLGEGRSWNHSETALTLVNQFPDMDAYYAATEFSYIYQPIVGTGRAGEIIVNADNCTSATRLAAEAGHVQVITEGTCLGHIGAFLLAYNAVSGHNLNPMDGTGGYIKNPQIIMKSYDEVAEWTKYMIENEPFPLETMHKYLGIYNEDLTFGQLKDWLENWSIDEVKDRLG